MKRKKSFEQACREYPNRYTMEHVPAWARSPNRNGGYYAPQFTSDREWYEHTRFRGEEGWIGTGTQCYTSGETWPLGTWLQQPYQGERVRAATQD